MPTKINIDKTLEHKAKGGTGVVSEHTDATDASDRNKAKPQKGGKGKSKAVKPATPDKTNPSPPTNGGVSAGGGGKKSAGKGKLFWEPNLAADTHFALMVCPIDGGFYVWGVDANRLDDVRLVLSEKGDIKPEQVVIVTRLTAGNGKKPSAAKK